MVSPLKGTKLSESTKRKISLACKGKKRSELVRQAMVITSTGRKHTDAVKRKISIANKGKIFSKEHLLNMSLALKGISSPFKGKKRNIKIGVKISFKLKGRKLSDSHKAKIALSCFGKKHSEETKQKLSIKHAAKIVALGIPTCVDAGATEFFNNLNQTEGFHIQHPNVYFKELGYFADGYDPVLHAWFEYDTPCHLKESYKQHDAIRQNRIIGHFIKTGKSLNSFWRIDATNGNPAMKKVWP
jgi:hypothetical protein